MKHFLSKLFCCDFTVIRSPLPKKEVLRRARNIKSFNSNVRNTDLDDDSFSLFYSGATGHLPRSSAFSMVAKASVEEQGDETLIHVRIRPLLPQLLLSACLSVFLVLLGLIGVGTHLATGFEQAEHLGHIVMPFCILLLIQGILLFSYRLPAKELKKVLHSAFVE